MGELLEVEVRAGAAAEGDIAVVVARGEIDLSNHGELATALASPSCERSEGILLDLRELDFMDSSGLQTVLAAARAADGRFAVLLREGTAVLSLFEIAELSGHLHFGCDEDAALVGIRAKAADGRG